MIMIISVLSRANGGLFQNASRDDDAPVRRSILLAEIGPPAFCLDDKSITCWIWSPYRGFRANYTMVKATQGIFGS